MKKYYKLFLNKKNKWISIQENNCLVYIQGEYIKKNKRIINIKEIFEYIKINDINDSDSLKRFYQEIDGFFIIIIEKDNKLFIIQDRIRSYQIYYTNKDNCLYVSDDAHLLKQELDFSEQNDYGVLEFLLCGYVIGGETLYKEIKQLLPGQCLIFDIASTKIKVKELFRYLPALNTKEIKIDDKVKEYWNILNNVFERFADYIKTNNLIPVVPLSGGRDSRLLAVMLKQHNINNVICYTYGTREHEEVKTSKKIAEKLGYKWLFEPYTKEKWNYEYNKGEIVQYLNYSSGLSVRPHLLDFIAVKKLFSGNRKDYIFLPGHTLDFLAGGHIPKSLFNKKNITVDNLINSIIKKHFRFHTIYDKEQIKVRIKETLKDVDLYNDDNKIAAFEYWDWQQRQSKFIMNSLNVYNYFNFSWYMPFWEKSMMDFFKTLPSEWRYNQNFEKYALNKFFPEYFEKIEWKSKDIDLKKKKSKYMKNIIKIINKLFNLKNKSVNKIYDYGLERFGAFDIESLTLNDFYENYITNTGAKSIFYFFTLDLLFKENIDLSFLNIKYLEAYLKVKNK